MLRTNTKKARENVKKYIMQDFDYIAERAEYNGEEIREDETEKALVIIYKAFLEEYGWAVTKCRQSYQEAFTNWAAGLAMGGLFLYYYNVDAVELLGDILEETEEERSKYTQEKAENLLTYLIFAECQKAYYRKERN